MTQLPDAYRITLPQFEGPFDLLLFFIERDEIDIRNIPIAKITNDFFDYIHQARELNISLAGEFILVAARLMSIKTKMLLPRTPVDEEGNEIDPRQELVDRLLEYKRYKAVIGQLRTLEEARAQRFGRELQLDQFQEIIGDAVQEAEWESISLFRLFKTFERVLQRQADRAARPVHRVMRWPYTVQEESIRILKTLHMRGRVSFIKLFGECHNRVHAIVTFLSLLDLLNSNRIELEVTGDAANEFIVVAHDDPSEEE